MAETDYREISQGYAQGAIKAVIIVNGGAAVAVLNQMEELSNMLPRASIGLSIIIFVLGVVAGSACWIAGFISTRYVDRALRGRERDYSVANGWMYFGMILVLLGILLFASGAVILALSFMSFF
jgi:dolichol kinase